MTKLDRALLSANMRWQLDRTVRWQRTRMRNQIVREKEALAESKE